MENMPFNYWQNVAFTDKTRVRLTSSGIVRVSKKWNKIQCRKLETKLAKTKDRLCFGEQYVLMAAKGLLNARTT